MPALRTNRITLILAVLVAMSSFPAQAGATIVMRCAGSGMVMKVTERTMASMPCCRHIVRSSHVQPQTGSTSVISSVPTCKFSITGDVERSHPAVAGHTRTIVVTAPALGPPAAASVKSPSIATSTITPCTTHAFPTARFRSHGLRAPPIS